MTRAQTGHVSCHHKLLPLLLRSPAEHCGGHPVHYNVFCQYCPSEKASDVVHSRGASAELPDRRPTPHWTEEDK